MKVLNFGSLNIDYVYRVERFALPGETIPAINMERFSGEKDLTNPWLWRGQVYRWPMLAVSEVTAYF